MKLSFLFYIQSKQHLTHDRHLISVSLVVGYLFMLLSIGSSHVRRVCWKYQTIQERPLGTKYSCVYEFMTKLNMQFYIKRGVCVCVCVLPHPTVLWSSAE